LIIKNILICVVGIVIAFQKISDYIKGYIMLKHWLKILLRINSRYKGHLLIKILSLTIGITSCLLIFLWVQHETGYGEFNANADRLYRVTQILQYEDGPFPIAVTPATMGQNMVSDFPELTNYCRIMPRNNVLIRTGDKKIYEAGCIFADSSLFKMFSFPFIHGNPDSAFNTVDSIVITRRMAEKYFGNINPVGQFIGINKGDYKITGVIENIPDNSHIQFDFIMNMEVLFKRFGFNRLGDNEFYTYVLSEKNADTNTLYNKLEHYSQKFEAEDKTIISLQNIKDIHLKSNYAIDYYGRSEDKTTLVLFFTFAAFGILITACINYINLTTARASSRTKEIGVRKVNGADKANIANQFFLETISLTILAVLLSLVLVFLLLPIFNNITGKQLEFSSLNNLNTILALLGIASITSIISGIYPALILSSFKPVQVIKGSARESMKGNLFRRILVVFQFTISLILIIGTIIVYGQLGFMINKELGFEKSHLVYLRKTREIANNWDSFKTELLKNPDIRNLTTSSDIPTHTVHSTVGFKWAGKPSASKNMIHWHSVDTEYFKTMGINIAEGRDFSEEYSTDIRGENFIINDEAAKMMGIDNPVGKQFEFWGEKGTIIGLVKGFHFKSLHEQIEPLVFLINPAFQEWIIARISSKNVNNSLSYIESTYNDFEKVYPASVKFIDAEVAKLYGSENQTRKIFLVFSFLAILISCIGLLGLTAYLVERKTREIGIRKVLGATYQNLVRSLSKETLYLVILSNIFAWPISYILMHSWLRDFAYRNTISPWYFLGAGLMTLTIAVATVIYHISRIARINPIEVLRNE
jgi:ABC-type antimicrobial peptide transport system permease subunit